LRRSAISSTPAKGPRNAPRAIDSSGLACDRQPLTFAESACRTRTLARQCIEEPLAPADRAPGLFSTSADHGHRAGDVSKHANDHRGRWPAAQLPPISARLSEMNRSRRPGSRPRTHVIRDPLRDDRYRNTSTRDEDAVEPAWFDDAGSEQCRRWCLPYGSYPRRLRSRASRQQRASSKDSDRSRINPSAVDDTPGDIREKVIT
jgi:hypothetical protein